jgi:hypothetical protein
MRVDGALVLVERVDLGKGSLEPQTDYGPAMVEALRRRGVSLPESEDAFLIRANRAAAERDRRMSTSFTPEELRSCVTDSGFVLQDESGPIRMDRANGASIVVEILVSAVSA